MKALIALAAAALLSAPSAEHGPIFAGLPPERHQGDSVGVVAYVSDITAYCGQASPGFVIYGCARTVDGVRVAILPNPCLVGAVNFYARLACHEAAHANHGWGGNHEL